MKTYLNRTQISQLLRLAPATVQKRIESGEYAPDAWLGIAEKGRKQHPLFDAAKHQPK